MPPIGICLAASQGAGCRHHLGAVSRGHLYMSYHFDLNDAFGGFSPATPPDGCTQCGICVSGCPTFVKTQDQDQSPMGRIRLMRTLDADHDDGALSEAWEKPHKLESCLGCYSCASICPSRVDFGNLLDRALARVRSRRPPPRLTRMMLGLARHRGFIKPLIRIVWMAQVVGARALSNKLRVTQLLGLQRADALLGPVTYPRRLRNRVRQAAPARRVALFIGCFSSALEQRVQQASIDALNALGVAAEMPTGQGCCGALHRHNGDLTSAETLARANIRAFLADQADVVVTTSSGCAAALKAYDKWLDGGTLGRPVMDISDYLAGVLTQMQPTLAPVPIKVALHAPCTLRQSEGQAEAVLAMLQRIPGLQVVPLSGEPRCCGAGGSQMLTEAETADALCDDTVNEIGALGLDALLSSNLGCAMHLRAGLKRAGIDIPLLHPVQLLSRSLGDRGESPRVLRRLRLLREWSHEQVEQVFP